MRKLGMISAIVLLSCGSREAPAPGPAAQTSPAPVGQATTHVKSGGAPEDLVGRLKTRLCDFLTDAEVQAAVGVEARVAHVSGYDGTTGHYCSYNWDDFASEARFAYVMSTVGKPDQVGKSQRAFAASSSVSPVGGLALGQSAAYWNPSTSRLVLFYPDVQVYVDLRKVKVEDPRAVAVKLASTALGR